MADKTNKKEAGKTPLGTDVPDQELNSEVNDRIQSETPHGIVDLANAGGDAPIDASSLNPDEQPPLPETEAGTGFTDTGGNNFADPGGSIHNSLGGGNMKTSPMGANEGDTRDLNQDVVPDSRAAEVGGARGNQSDMDTDKLPGDKQAPRLPARMQDATRERKAS